MADLITLDEYEAAGGDRLSLSASLAVSAASDIVRQYLHQTVTLVTNDVVILNGTGTRALVLPELPVVAINTVTVGADPVLAVSEYRESRGLLWRLNSAVWTREIEVVVNYTHGWAVVPADIKLVTARLAVAVAADTAATPGLRQESIQDYSYSRGDMTSNVAGELAVIARRVTRQVPVP